MATWKIGYPNTLDAVASADAGRALYNVLYTNDTFNFSTKMPYYDSARCNGDGSGTTITTDSHKSDVASWASNIFANGTVVNVGANDGTTSRIGSKWRKVTANGTVTLTTSAAVTASDFTDNDYIMVFGGDASVKFEADGTAQSLIGNPSRWSIKRGYDTSKTLHRYWGIEEGTAIATGRKADDLVFDLRIYQTSDATTVDTIYTRLDVLLSNQLNMKGNNYVIDNTEDIAPIVIEMGSTTYRIVGILDDWTITSDANVGDGILDIQLHLTNVSIPMPYATKVA